MSDLNEIATTGARSGSRARSTLSGQAVRYLAVGGIAFGVDFGVLVLLTEITGHYLIAASVAFVLGLMTNYLLCIRWVFTSRSLDQPWLEFAIFVAVGLVGLVLNEVLMYLGTDKLGFDYRISKLFSVALVLCWNFGARKILLFRDQG
ncbi:MAG TPA: GtrA family protein [Pirellulales bacterium]|nr:GtrA family protein [Pirellulales bacterium]